MSDSKVEALSLLAPWKMDCFGHSPSRRLDSFRIGVWKWYLQAEAGPSYSYGSSRAYNINIKLFLEDCLCSEEQPPTARFLFRSSKFGSGQKPHASPVNENLFRKGEPFVWVTRSDLYGKFIIEGEEASPALLPDAWVKSMALKSSHLRLSRMIRENMLTDCTIEVSGSTLNVHKIVLIASSPVFQRMFEHELREKISPTIEIEDMPLKSVRALLSYLYGVIERDDLWTHRHVLLSAADKYDIADLKICCEESLLEDITSDNVLERLHDSCRYRLHHLKMRCFSFLFDFGKIEDVRDKVSSFICRVEQELVAEMFQEALTVWSRRA